MRADPPLGHGAVLAGLWRAARAGRLPHALCFEGRSGVGKFHSARRLALGLLCAEGPGDPCGACGPCKRVLSGDWRGNHPDLFVVDPTQAGDEVIKVEHVAARDGGEDTIEEFLHLRALEGGWRIVLLREAHRMNAAAQNALLKTLEEPGPGVLLVLTTHRPELLLDTIRSRCVRLRFARLSAEDAARVARAAGVPDADAARLARWCGGSPGDAAALAARGGVEMRGLLAAVARGEREPLAAARAALAIEGEFEGQTPRARERDRLRTALDLAVAIASDALRHAAGVPAAELRHGDVAQEPAARRLDRRALEALIQARADVDRNVTPQAVLERALCVLGGGASSAFARGSPAGTLGRP